MNIDDEIDKVTKEIEAIMDKHQKELQPYFTKLKYLYDVRTPSQKITPELLKIMREE